VLAGEFTRAFTPAWQYAMRSTMTGALEEQRLRYYERVLQFADWLQSQPSKQEILARLARCG
jgi:hypothetical protein